jgi:hypothetical protein
METSFLSAAYGELLSLDMLATRFEYAVCECCPDFMTDVVGMTDCLC